MAKLLSGNSPSIVSENIRSLRARGLSESDAISRANSLRVRESDDSGRQRGGSDLPAPTGRSRRFVVVTSDFSGLGWGLALKREGEDVVIATCCPEDDPKEVKIYKEVGEGLIDRVPLKQAVLTYTKPTDYWMFAENIEPQQADKLRARGQKVFGTSVLSERMEHDRHYAVEIANKAGLKSPLTQECSSRKEGIAFLESHADQAFVFKPDNGGTNYSTFVPVRDDDADANQEVLTYLTQMTKEPGTYILQERVRGTEVNVEGWLYEGEPFFANTTLEAKRKDSGELGEMSGCFDRETEILTRRGWVRFDKLDPSDTVANLDDAGKSIVWSPILNLIRYPYQGEMHHYIGKRVDLLMTPNHRLWGDIRRGQKHIRRGFVESRDLPYSDWVEVPDVWYQSEKSPDSFTVPDCEKGRRGPQALGFEVNFNDWAKFLGIWVAEGYLSTNRQGTVNGVIGVSQINRKKEVFEILDRIPVQWCREKTCWTTNCLALGRYLSEFVGQGTFTKRVPNYVKDASKESIRSFLDGFAIGDGSVNKTNGRRILYTSNKGLADDLCELVIRAGWWPVLHVREPRQWHIRGKSGMSKTQYCINILERKGFHCIDVSGRRGSRRHLLDWDDEVFCVTTKTGVILVRRDGKSSWIGNCAGDVVKVIPLDSKLVKETVGKLFSFYKKSKYTGFADVNIILTEDGPRFLEVCNRCGYNGTVTLLLGLLKGRIGDLLADYMDGDVLDFESRFHPDWGGSLTLFLDHPRPGLPVHLEDSIKPSFYPFDGSEEEGDFLLRGYSHEVGIVVDHGRTPEEALMSCLEKVRDEDVSFPDMYYRTDLAKGGYQNSIIDRVHELEDGGWL